MFPGYSTLVFDTNILLTSMRLLRDLVEAAKWTIVVPLAGEFRSLMHLKQLVADLPSPCSHHRTRRFA